MSMAGYTPDEMMTIAASRALSNDDVCFVGIGAPSAACNVARLTHAPASAAWRIRARRGASGPGVARQRAASRTGRRSTRRL